METKHYVKIYNDNGNPTRHEVKVRSFNDETFKSVHKDEPHFTFFSRFNNSIALDSEHKLYLTSDDLFENDYFLTSEDIENFGDLEQENAYENLGVLSGINLSKNPVVPDEEELGIRYTRAYLENKEEKIISQSKLGLLGLSKKKIKDFIDSINVVSNENKNLGFDEVVEMLLSDCNNDSTIEIYREIANLLKKVPKFEAMKSQDTQLSFDLLGNIIDNPDANQKQ